MISALAVLYTEEVRHIAADALLQIADSDQYDHRGTAKRSMEP